MNTSAKMTVFSLLAASAVGVLVFVGCTVDSSLDTNTDGGGSTFRDGATDIDEDAGTGTGVHVLGSVCQTTTQKGAFSGGATDTLNGCQKCLETSCCTALKGCYDLPGIDAGTGTATTCEDYADCVASCDDNECIDLCDTATPDYVAPYDTITSCGMTRCAGECDFPDGG